MVSIIQRLRAAGTLLPLWLASVWPLAGLAAPLEVFVSVLPQKTFLERVGGEHVRVTSLTRPGQSPETFEPTPRQVAALAMADLFVVTGMPFESAWKERLLAANPRMRVLDAREGIALLPAEDHGHQQQVIGASDPEHVHEAGDPHVWTSPRLVARMSVNIRDALAELDPTHAEDYARNQTAFAAELARVDEDIRHLLADLPSRKFLVFHPAWGYFAQDYDLIQVPIEQGGKEPGPRTLASLIADARRDGIRVVFVQPQSDPRFAARIAEAIGGQLIAIDPLAPDYLSNLRAVAQQIAAAGKSLSP
jgi:zinc transport system substrate-binding protein